MPTDILIHRNADELAAAAASRFITALADLQADGGVPAVALTGGGVGIATLTAVAQSAARATVDWRRVEIFWGDERFVPSASEDRNDRQARAALLDHLNLDPHRIHAIAASDGEFGDDPDAAAAAYANELAHRPPLDLVLLGMGTEGHVASIFPHSPAAVAEGSAVAVRDCPKPPPMRVSMTFPVLQAARRVWLLVSGSAKADAVARALGGAAPIDLPAAGAHGADETVWFLDDEAAAGLSRTGRQAESTVHT